MIDFKGTVAAIFTPFDDDDRVDLAYMKNHIRFIEEHGARGIVASGTNGEFWAMDTDERKGVFETCAAAKGGLFMVAGTGASSLTETIELTRFAESAGADAAMVVPPYFLPNVPEEGLIEYYKRVFDSVSLPIFLYNIPQCSGIRITDNIIRALEHYPHLAGVKDSSCELPSTLHYAEAFPKLKVFVGSDHQVLSALTAGAVGHISGMPNAFPTLTTDIYEAFVAGQDATTCQLRLSMARTIYSCFFEFPVNKYVMSRRGFPLRHCRLPLTDLTKEQQSRFEQLMRAVGLWDL